MVGHDVEASGVLAHTHNPVGRFLGALKRSLGQQAGAALRGRGLAHRASSPLLTSVSATHSLPAVRMPYSSSGFVTRSGVRFHASLAAAASSGASKVSVTSGGDSRGPRPVTMVRR